MSWRHPAIFVSLLVPVWSPWAYAEEAGLDAESALALLAGDDQEAEEPKRAAFELQVATGVLSRRFEYEDDHFSTLHAYKLDAAPLLSVDVQWFPGAYWTAGPGSWVGVAGHFEQAVGVRSRLGDETLASHASAIRWGFLGRFPLGPATLSPAFGYGRHRFSGEPLGDGRTVLPPLDYEFVRVGVDVEVRVERVLFGVVLGHRIVLTSHTLDQASWWPDARVQGTDMGLHVGFAVTPDIDLKLGGEFRRYAFDLRPSADSVRALRNQVAGGALDLYAIGWFGVAWHPLWHQGDP